MFANSRNRAATAVLLLVIGVVLLIVGGWAWAACSALPTVGGAVPACGGFAVLVVLGIILLVVGIVIAVASAQGGRRTIYPTTDPAVPPPLIQPVVVQRTVVEQTVEVRCRYCQTLNPVTSARCSACGAAL